MNQSDAWIRPFSPTILKTKLSTEHLQTLLELSNALFANSRDKIQQEPSPVLSHVQERIEIEREYLGPMIDPLENTMSRYLHKILPELDASQYVEDLNVQHTRAWITSAWFSGQYAGDFIPTHKHSADLAGVAYLKVPEAMDQEAAFGGQISFFDGRSQSFVRERLEMTPEVGDILVFPGWLAHQVYPFRCAGERRILSFNAMVTVYEP